MPVPTNMPTGHFQSVPFINNPKNIKEYAIFESFLLNYQIGFDIYLLTYSINEYVDDLTEKLTGVNK